MAKSSSNNKKRKAVPPQAGPPAKKSTPGGSSSAAAAPAQPTTTSTSAPAAADDDDGLIGGVIYPEELEAAVEVLRALAAQPELMKAGKGGGAGMKAFKGAMWDTWRALGEVSGTGSSVTSRISTTLQNGQWLEALILLSELRLRGQVPKLGSLQRWVRECDAAAVQSSERRKGKAAAASGGEAGEEEMLWAVLDAILRACTGVPAAVKGHDEGAVIAEVPVGRKGVRRWASWDVRPLFAQADDRSPANYWRQVAEGTLLTAEEKAAFVAGVQALDITPGPSRRPPNLYPAIVQHLPPSTAGLLALEVTPAREVQRWDVPGVPGARLLTDVLTPDECRKLVGMSEAVGMIEDTPVAGSAAELNSVLAHNLILLAPSTLMDPLFERMRALLPASVPVPKGSSASGLLKGLNRRFRIYRYREGSVYRPHVDGAWPSSSELPPSADGKIPAKYVYDADPSLYSRFTCLFYLNDSFTHGETTFFVPCAQRDGVLNARAVRPLQGSALIFPHGATEGSLLHEGSAVFPNDVEGAKYVIRTEVLYEVERLASAGEGGVVGGLV